MLFYSDIKVSLSRIAGGEYEGVKFVGNNTWRKDLEFGGGSYYLNLICDYTYRKVAFYVLKFEFNPQTTNRKLSLEEKNKHNTISIMESDIRNMVRESVIRIISEAMINGHTFAVEKQLGKWKCIDGIYADYDFSEFGKKDYCQDVRMYMDTTAPKDVPATYCLFRRIDNGKYFYAKIVMAPELGPNETKFLLMRRSEVPWKILILRRIWIFP